MRYSFVLLLMTLAFTACSTQSNVPAIPPTGGGLGVSSWHTVASSLIAQRASKPILISACAAITQPGTYDLTANLTSSGQTCVAIQNTSNVTLNCQNHTITAGTTIAVSAVNGYTIENCSLQLLNGGNILTIANSSNGTLTKNTVGYASTTPRIMAAISVSYSTKLTMQSNTFYQPYQQSFSTGTVIENNAMSCPLSLCSAVVLLDLGSSNQVVDNKIDGGTGIDARESSGGADDGIVFGDETNDVIKGNTIENAWDCGIEISGTIKSASITKNTITNASNCGLGGWFFMSLSDSTIADNTVSGSATLFQFFRIDGLRPAGFAGPGVPADTGVSFTDNSFDNNTFTNPYAIGDGYGTGDSSFIPFDDEGLYMDYNGNTGGYSGVTSPTPSQFHLSNNKFAGNNFGTTYPTFFGEPAVAGAVVDQGGNVCAPTTYADYPLACGKPL